MFESKYGKVLTVFLIIAIIAIIGLVGFFIFKNINSNKMDKGSETKVEEFGKNEDNTTPKPDDADDDNKDEDDNTEIPDIVPPTEVPSNNSSTNNGSGSRPTNEDGFVVVGNIEIPKTNLDIEILEKVTKKSLESAVGILYPSNAKLNQPGNVVIAGHNYKNNLFFSKNKNLNVGDKIYIKDETGKTLTYVIYDKFETSDTDTSFYKRDTGGVPEITLTTCVETDSSKRTIILARAQ